MSGGERDTARDRMDEQDNRSVVSALSFDNIMFDPETQNARAQSGWNAIQSLKFQVCRVTYTVPPYNHAKNRSLCKLTVLTSYVLGACMTQMQQEHIPAYEHQFAEAATSQLIEIDSVPLDQVAAQVRIFSAELPAGFHRHFHSIIKNLCLLAGTHARARATGGPAS